MNVGVGALLLLVFLLGVLAALVVAIAVTAGLIRGTRASAPQTARDILDARYANGEISREAYEDMRAQLEDAP